MERVPFLIEGIVEAPPTNSQIQFEMLTSMASWGAPNYFMWSYVWANTLTYVRLIPQADYVTVNDKIPDMVKTYAGETTLRIWGISYEELEAKGDYINFYLQPMEEVYLHSADLGNRVGPVGNIQVYKGLVAVAIFILLIACINFMNLSTAQAGQRAKEVGIRKTLGSASSRLRSQFLLESMVYSGLAWLLSLGLYELLVVSLQRALPDTLVFGLGLGQRMVVTFLVAVFMALLAGLYPAFYLTAFRPIEALKGKLNRGLGAARLRNGLVVLQFSISMAMIISTLVVLRQWQYARRVDVGFQRDQVLLIENTDNLGDNLPAFMDAMRAQSGVISASGTTSIPGSWAWGDFWETPGSDKTTALDVIQTDPEFGNTLGLEMMEGRYLSEQFPSDSAAIVLNEAAVAEFGLEAPVLGKQVIYTSPFPGMPSHFTVVGVVKDFHMADFNQSISSVGILMQNGHNFPMNTNFIAVRYQAEQTAAVIASAQYLWKELQVETAFSYGFLDETFGQLFEAEETLTRVFAIFSGLTIFIACLGLFGLAAFTAERRTKEVGVRKVLGATEVQLLGMLNRHFTRLVVISFLIGAPVAAYLMNLWLAEFVYRIPLSPWIFLIGGLAGLLISWLTVSFQSWRVARLNPIQSLRDE
ncbi:MAG TPA: hypothetical protein DCP28_27455 [Cytophagales bacterium]|nr:hypothetical protein [Cytophagales bacterium]